MIKQIQLVDNQVQAALQWTYVNSLDIKKWS